MREVLFYYGIIASVIVTVVNVLYVALTLRSAQIIRKQNLLTHDNMLNSMKKEKDLPGVSLLVPSYCEELTIEENVKNLLKLDYPKLEVIVINDGSDDRTVDLLKESFQLEKVKLTRDVFIKTERVKQAYRSTIDKRLIVIDKENGGKADSLNVGISYSKYPLIASIDADSLLEEKALLKLVKHYLRKPKEVVAVGGQVRVVNSSTIDNGEIKTIRTPKNIWARFQALEYIKAFVSGRTAWSKWNGLIIVSGAFGLFDKRIVKEIKGYRGGFPGEDMNIILKLHKHHRDENIKYRIDYCPNAICFTQAPESYRILSSQRKRWGRGNVKNMVEIGLSMTLRPKYKAVGLITLPYTILYETLNPLLKLSGALALLGYSYYNMTNLKIVLFFMLLNFLLGLILSYGSILLDMKEFRFYTDTKELVKLLATVPIMFLGYYYLNSYWKFIGFIDYLRNNNTWGTMVRQSFDQEESKSA
ncbi:glycosyltransferase [Bacillus sp. RG28]|uniref:Glycosyltransferase n=1 Tax=Gottfriedia endophytica TaxID=2820819 RepID=A0A940SJ67_9BACI|nr:glycosyltransferase family 2 protein [Gottfriedia endophytica]MBP0725161.1 glycosyltransferase [Gottfriedia endophytica]